MGRSVQRRAIGLLGVLTHLLGRLQLTKALVDEMRFLRIDCRVRLRSISRMCWPALPLVQGPY